MQNILSFYRTLQGTRFHAPFFVMQMKSLFPFLCWLSLTLGARAEVALMDEMNKAVSIFDRLYGGHLQELAGQIYAESENMMRHPDEARRWTALLKEESTRETFRQLSDKCSDAEGSWYAVRLQVAMATFICRCAMEDRQASAAEIESELAFVQQLMSGLELRRRLLRAELGRDVMPVKYSNVSGHYLTPVEVALNEKKEVHYMIVYAEEGIFDELWTVYVKRLSLSPTEAIGRFMPHALTMERIDLLVKTY